MPSPSINLAHVRSEIEGGLVNESRRLHCAWKNRMFYDGHMEMFPTREENLYHERWDMRRTSRLMRRVIHVLTDHLYKKPPTRTLSAGPEATDWLERCYKKASMAALWPQSDRMGLLNDWCAFRFAGNDDPETVVDIELFTSDQLVVWTLPGKPRVPGAVATIEREDAGRTLTLWTDDEILTYYTPKWGQDQTAGATAWKFRSSEPNPYETLPFAFVHSEYPTTEFHTEGIGDFLREVNDAVNFSIDNMGDAVRYLAFPIPVAEGVSPAWTPPPKLKPGQWVTMPGSQATAGDDAMSKPSLNYVSPPLDFVAVTWDDLNRYIDRALEDIGVPPGTIRLTADSSSGVAMMVEQGPLLAWAEARRQPFSMYESDAAKKAAQVASAHLRANGLAVPPWLDEAAREPGMGLKWPQLYVQLPGPERDRSDEWRLGFGLASKIQLLMEREDLTRVQALEKLKAVAADNEELTAMGIEPGLPKPEPIAPENAPLDEPIVEPRSGE